MSSAGTEEVLGRTGGEGWVQREHKEAEVHLKSEEQMFGRRAAAFGDTPCAGQRCQDTPLC